MSRAERRRNEKASPSVWVHVTAPEPFVDCMGGTWTISRDGQPEELTFADVLLWSVRRMPVERHEDSERALGLIRMLRESDGAFEVRKSDYDWLVRQLKAHAHKLWVAPDAALLVEYVEDGMSTVEQPAAEPKEA